MDYSLNCDVDVRNDVYARPVPRLNTNVCNVLKRLYKRLLVIITFSMSCVAGVFCSLLTSLRVLSVARTIMLSFIISLWFPYFQTYHFFSDYPSSNRVVSVYAGSIWVVVSSRIGTVASIAQTVQGGTLGFIYFAQNGVLLFVSRQFDLIQRNFGHVWNTSSWLWSN